MRVLVISLVAAFALLGCPPKDGNKTTSAAPCKKVGDNCEYSPGKLGTCVSIDTCEHEPCLACQSQH